ncbi:MAG: DUF2620 domain-containing protein [Brevinema sp.]
MKIAIGGQLSKSEIQDLIQKYSGGQIETRIFSDNDAAMQVKNGTYDYYVGACQSGAGGALAMAYAILGQDKCATIAMAGLAPNNEKVRQYLENGIKAFGFTNDQVDNSIELLINNLL